MTVYKARPYYDSGEPSLEDDEVSDSVTEVWEVAGGCRWSRHPDDPGVWVPDGEDEPIELMWFELIRDFYEVTDDPSEIAKPPQGCPVCGPSGCAGHTRKPSDVLTGGAQ